MAFCNIQLAQVWSKSCHRKFSIPASCKAFVFTWRSRLQHRVRTLFDVRVQLTGQHFNVRSFSEMPSPLFVPFRRDATFLRSRSTCPLHTGYIALPHSRAQFKQGDIALMAR
jgi:hypothetical protein